MKDVFYWADGQQQRLPDDGVIISEATQIACAGCTAVTSITAPHATWISCSGCTALTTITAPHATWICCFGCTALTRIDPLRLPSSDAERALVHAIADRVAADPDALNMKAWHTCATTHCLAGWAQVLSGSKQNDTKAEACGRNRVPCLQHLFFSDNELARSELFRIAEASGWKRGE